MKIIALNGSPRKNWNTALLLENALKGAKDAGAETEMVHLYDINFKGCISCFLCKRQNSKYYGKCALNDGLKPVLERIEAADALILGSPIYFSAVTGVMRSFLERFMFQYMLYTNPPSTIFKGKLKVGFIYTMNINSEQFAQSTLKTHLERNESALKMIFGNIQSMHSFDTYQTNDYSNFEYTYFDVNKKEERRNDVFPVDCEKAFFMGRNIVTSIS
ncbi:MAG: flavodoxin family protein [Candidatus Wallbacteria bacterium]